MIELISRKERNKERQITFIKVTDSAHGIDAQEFSVGNVPAELTDDKDVQVHLDSRENEIILIILRKHYPEADIDKFREEGKSELEAFQAWIDNGCKNKLIFGYKDEKQTKPIYEERIIEKKEIEYKHPPGIALKLELKEINTIENAKALIGKILDKMT